jgi:dynein heavy chain
MLDVRAMIKEMTPYVICGLQELEKVNAVLIEMDRALSELELGLAGALNISDVMDAMIINLAGNSVPPLWLKMCAQIGPTGTYNKKSMSSWFADLVLRHKQFGTWSSNAMIVPPSLWLPGLYNSMGYVTACLQTTARQQRLALDEMRIHTEITDKRFDQITAQPDNGTYVHGMYCEGGRWDVATNAMAESRPKELHPMLPVMHITGVTEANVVTKGVYICPIYGTTIRGPTFIFAAPMRTVDPAHKWILAAVCLLFQNDS